MYNIRKFWYLSCFHLTKRNLAVGTIQKNMKLVSSVHTNSQKITDVPHSQKITDVPHSQKISDAPHSQKITDDPHPQKGTVLVYEGPLRKRMKIVKFISLSSSMIGFAVFPKVMLDLSNVNILLACAAGVVSSFFLSTPFMLNWITKRYVIELHFDNETKEFTAKTFNLVNQIKEVKFKASDVIVPDLPGMLSSILVNGKPLFVDANMVKDPDAYAHMMGYDKPLDFSINLDEQNDNTKAK